MNISQQGATYAVDGGPMDPIDTQWVYSHYRVNTEVDQSLAQLDVDDGSTMTGISDPATNQHNMPQPESDAPKNFFPKPDIGSMTPMKGGGGYMGWASQSLV